MRKRLIPYMYVIFLIIVLALALAIARDQHLRHHQPRPQLTPSVTAPTTSAPATRRPVAVPSYPACTHEDGSGTTSPCLLDCAQTPRWCANGQVGLWLRWNDAGPDRRYPWDVDRGTRSLQRP